jgi:phosphogluconate dehydratase
VFVPAGPMTTGLANDEKAKIRQLLREGPGRPRRAARIESKAYHGAGTCTFYGTANSNQMLMEVMGLHLPRRAFITPGTPLRDALTEAAAARVAITAQGGEYTPLGPGGRRKSIVNAIVALLATGGSTNHTMHLVAIAGRRHRDRLGRLRHAVGRGAAAHAHLPERRSRHQPLPRRRRHGHADRQLLTEGLLHDDVTTVAGQGPARRTPKSLSSTGDGRDLEAAPRRGIDTVLRPVADPFSQADSGLKLAVGQPRPRGDEGVGGAPRTPPRRGARLSCSLAGRVHAAYKAGQLDRDFIAVLRFQGPRANGMPELHR